MPDERHTYSSLPIPTYEEALATSPYSSSSPFAHSTQHRSAEHDGLLSVSSTSRTRPATHHNYRPATVESDRSSYDGNFTSPEVSDDEDEDQNDSDNALRRDMEEMDFVDIPTDRRAPQRTRLRFPKPFSQLRDTLSAIHLPSFPTFSSFPSQLVPSFSFITSRVPALPYNLKIPWSIIARLFGLVVIISGVYGLMVFRILGSGSRFMDPLLRSQQIQAFVLDNIRPQHIEEYLQEITFDDHVAGTEGGFFAAARIKQHFQNAGLDSVIEEDYNVYLNYPQKSGRAIEIVDPPDLRWKATLEEEIAPENAHKHQLGVFHAHSKSGDVTGPLIYANSGSPEDFIYLENQGVDVKGSVVLVRDYGSQTTPGLKVKAAELAGAVGCIIYSDPGDDGGFRGKSYPKGRWRPSDSVRRSSVSLTNWILGDVLTPGNASTSDAHRLSKDNNPALPNIPSLPIAWRDAEVLLGSLKGHGVQVKEDWVGGALNMEWWSGDVASSPKVNLKNMLDEDARQPIRNVMGTLQGFEDPDKIVYVGNHRDASCFGAVEPGSGTAVMLEVVRVLGMLRQYRWHPRRTIVFSSWDAGEYNLIGSTEYVEKHIDQVRKHGLAYININNAVSGSNFWADASPAYLTPLLRVLDRVAVPHENVTYREKWAHTSSQLGGLSVAGDYAAFQHLAGCASIDFGLSGPRHGFPSQSCYDSFEWMKSIGDPKFEYHTAAAHILVLLILQLADNDFIPFDIMHYAQSLQVYVQLLKSNALAIWNQQGDGLSSEMFSRLNTQPLEKAAEIFLDSANTHSAALYRFMTSSPLTSMLENKAEFDRRMVFNDILREFESNLLDLPAPDEAREGGIPGRNQFKYVVFGPQVWSGTDVAYFPGIHDAMVRGNWTEAQQQLHVAAKLLRKAATRLL